MDELKMDWLGPTQTAAKNDRLIEDCPTVPSIPAQPPLLPPPPIERESLLDDRLLLNAPGIEHEGVMCPALGGIPLLAKLGRGGMGAVYYGIHPRLNTQVAVKVLALQPNSQVIERFYREAQFAASVKSPHLVAVSDVNVERGLHFIVMEFVHGQSAGVCVRRVRKETGTGLAESVALDICIAATKGLAAAHAQGIVHRDIKPDNIMLPLAKGRPELNFKAAKLMDLGLARGEMGGDADGHALTATQVCLGTPGFMAPEQAAESKNCSAPADVFSMGATLFTLLAGETPFKGQSAVELLLNTAQQPHLSIRRLRPEVSLCTARLLDHCLAKYPNKRFSNGEILLEALKVCRANQEQPASAQQSAVEAIAELVKARQLAPQNSTTVMPRFEPAPRNDDTTEETLEIASPPVAAVLAQTERKPVPPRPPLRTPRPELGPAVKPSGFGDWNKPFFLAAGVVLICVGLYATIFSSPKNTDAEIESDQTAAPPVATKPAAPPQVLQPAPVRLTVPPALSAPRTLVVETPPKPAPEPPQERATRQKVQDTPPVDDAKISMLRRQIEAGSNALKGLNERAGEIERQLTEKDKQVDDLHLRALEIRRKSYDVTPETLKRLDQEHDRLATQINMMTDELHTLKRQRDCANEQILKLRTQIERGKRELDELSH